MGDPGSEPRQPSYRAHALCSVAGVSHYCLCLLLNLVKKVQSLPFDLECGEDRRNEFLQPRDTASKNRLKKNLNRVMITMGFSGGPIGKEPTCQCKKRKQTRVQSLGQKDSLEKGMATHSSILSWRTAWTDEPHGRATVHTVTKSQTRLK